jgi:hypothetical protein
MSTMTLPVRLRGLDGAKIQRTIVHCIQQFMYSLAQDTIQLIGWNLVQKNLMDLQGTVAY